MKRIGGHYRLESDVFIAGAVCKKVMVISRYDTKNKLSVGLSEICCLGGSHVIDTRHFLTKKGKGRYIIIQSRYIESINQISPHGSFCPFWKLESAPSIYVFINFSKTIMSRVN